MAVRFQKRQGTAWRRARSATNFALKPPALESIHEAAQQGNVERLKHVLNSSTNDINARYEGATPLLYAASACQTCAVELLLERGANPDATTPSGWRAVHCAAQADDTEALQLLLQRCGDAAATMEAGGGITPLHLAAFNGRLVAVQLLLASGALVDAPDKEGHTPLDDARYSLERARTFARCGCVQASEPASRWRASLEATMALIEEASALPTAAERRSLARRGWERSAAAKLLAAAECGDVRRLALLLNCGCTVAARDCDGATAAHLAAAEGHVPALSLLLERGASTDALDNYSDSPLHAAAHEGHLAAAWLLVARGADVVALNRFGVTPARRATQGRRGAWLAVVALLHTAGACGRITRVVGSRMCAVHV